MNGPAGPTSALRSLPKAELHLHLEGSVGPALLHRLAGAGRPQSTVPSREALRRLYRFTTFAGFLRTYATICGLLRTPEAWASAVVDLGRRLRRERVVHAEVFFSAAAHMKNGLPYAALVDALEDGAGRVEAAGGPSIRFLADGVRQWGVEEYHRMVEAVVRHPTSRVVAVGLGGDECALSAARFAGSLRPAREAGLAVVIHSGEFGEAREICRTIRTLRPDRIAHGIRAIQDRHTLAILKRRGIPLDVCLTSNRRTGAVPRGQKHPLLGLLAAGVRVTLGTDDPALFRCRLSGEYARAARLGAGPDALVRMAVEGARGCLLPAAERRRLVRVIGEAWTAARRLGRLPGRQVDLPAGRTGRERDERTERGK